MTALLLAGCGGGSATSAGGSAPEQAAPRAQPNAGDGAGPAQAKAPGRAQGGGDGEPAALPRVVPEDRAIIYTASLRVRARDVEATAARAVRIVSTAGGYVHDERTTTDPQRHAGATATLTFKIPAEKYQGVLDELGSRLGTRLHLEQKAQDVTQEVADVDARAKSARASLERLRQLLSEAETIGEVLSVEREIAEREAELESLEARQRALVNKTQYATVTLELVAPAAAKEEQRDGGFVAGLGAGWQAFLSSLGWLATVLGALLPFLVTFGVLGYAAWRVRAAVRRRRTAATPPAPSSPPAS